MIDSIGLSGFFAARPERLVRFRQGGAGQRNGAERRSLEGFVFHYFSAAAVQRPGERQSGIERQVRTATARRYSGLYPTNFSGRSSVL